MSEYLFVVPANCTRLAEEQKQAETVFVSLLLEPETDSVEGAYGACLNTDCSHFLEEAGGQIEPTVMLSNDQLELLIILGKWGPKALQSYLDWSDPIVDITPAIINQD